MKRRSILLLDGACLAAIPLAAVLAGWMLRSLPNCLSMQVGLLCPACGGTRCLLQMSRGNFAQALRLNPYFFCTAWLLLGLLILANIHAFSQGKWGGKLLRRVWQSKWIMVWAIGFVVFGAVRNVLILLR